MEEYDLTSTLEDGAVAFKLPSPKYPKGRRYVFQSPSGTVGLWLQNLIQFGQAAALGGAAQLDQVGKLVLDDNEEQDLYKRVMGDTLDAMLKDGVKWDGIQKAFTLLLGKWGANQPIADTLANMAGGAAAQPNREARRASSSRKAGSKSSPASTATRARTGGRGSTRSSATSGRAAAQAV